jgi:ribulose-5-phosphate 4-epimerase/fuculose-1-phosphate aldolase
MVSAIGDVMRRCYERGWITTRDGNVSIRRASESGMHITPSGVRKHLIRFEDIVYLPFADGKIVLKSDQKPSGELEMHQLLLQDSPVNRVVLHVHATHVVAAIFAGFKLDEIALEFPEINRYSRVAPNVPTLPAVSRELAKATYKALRGNSKRKGELSFDIVGQANHGVCAVGHDPWNAFEHVERLDHICEIVLKSGIKPSKRVDR